MRDDRFSDVERIAQSALERPDAERRAFVEDACAGDVDLRDEVLSLVSHEISADKLLGTPAIPSHTPLKKGHQLGPYQIEELLGAGGMGEVYRASDTRLPRDVAIKILPPHFASDPYRLGRFIAEAQTIAAVNDSRICTLYDIGEEDGIRFLVMELVKGETLASKLLSGPLPIHKTVRYAGQVAVALAEAHSKGVVHRDVKPANIIISSDDNAKLVDFGVARRPVSHETATRTGMTEPGVVVGTPKYMSPEQQRGGPVDARADIFSLGVVIFECLTGELPVKGKFRRGVPRDLRALVKSCLEKDASNRPDSAKWLAEELERFKTPTSLWARHRTTIAAASLAVVLLMGLVWLIQKRPPTQSAVASGPSPHLTALPCDAPAVTLDVASLCDGLTEVLVGRLLGLTASQPLQVTTLAEAVRRNSHTIDSARASLGATRVLSGMVQAGGDRFSVEYRVTDARSGQVLDRRSFSLAGVDAFTEQDRIAGWLVRLFGFNLTHPEREALFAQRTKNPQAYESYLRGLGALRVRRNGGSLDQALTALATAVELDSGFAPAGAAHGFAGIMKASQPPEKSWIEQALAACEKAVAVDRRLAEGHGCRGQALHALGRHPEAAAALEAAVTADPTYDDGHALLGLEQERDLHDFAAAEGTFRRAVKQRPGSWAPHAWLGNFFRRQARFEEAIAEFEKVVQLVPDSARALGILSGPLMYVGRYDEALAACERSVNQEPTLEGLGNCGMTYYRMRQFDKAAVKLQRARELAPGNHQVIGNLARIYHYAGKRSEATALHAEAIELARAERLVPATKDALHVALAEYCAKTGRRAEALDQLRQVGLDRFASTRASDPHLLFFAAVVYHQLGERKDALSWLERALDWGLPVAELRAFPELDDLKSDPDFQRLVGQHGRRGS